MLVELLDGSVSQDDYLRENNVIVKILELPKKIRGFIYSYNDFNIIIINKNLSHYLRKKTILHELAHLELCHLQLKKVSLNFKIDDLEDDADIYINNLKQTLKDLKNYSQ